ncbi:type VII secretion target [Schaalia vaccimaxillae]|uniref:type VII secretion target n=1 Tax=Schaalia vaccimaxillae TaxID=183916 RepID=UPI0003B6B354|nr:type VII secretion target [Schaalia vaccimaxillae]
MSNGFEISTSGLRSHATEIRTAASEIDSARVTADSTTGMVSGGAFGLMFMWMAPLVQGRIDTLATQISDFVNAERNVSDQLIETADSFEETETQLKQTIESVIAELGS